MKYLLMFLFLFCQISTFADSSTQKDSNTQKESDEISGFLSTSNASSSAQKSNIEEEFNIALKTSFHIGAVSNSQLPIFGRNLFGSQCQKNDRSRFFNPEYRISGGDEVNIQMWGAVELSQKLKVDTQGNIFISEVGPVHVEGIENQKLNSTIQANIKKTFKKGVNIYADLVTTQPVQVYVTGYVNSPGLYSGLSSDSIIYFLCEADGINPNEGSFRDIRVIRSNKEIQKVDLYDFLLNGNVNLFQLHQGDTIVVKQQKHTIAITGDVKNSYQFEVHDKSTELQSLSKLANVAPTATFVRIDKNQGLKPTFYYKKLDLAELIQIESGDRVTFVADKEVKQTLVTVNGRINGKHQYVLTSGTSLLEFIETLKLKPDANLENIQLFRESTAKEQKSALNANLSRLKRKVMSTESSDALTGDDAKVQAVRAELVMKFIEDAQNAQPKGQIVLGDKSKWSKVFLESNDVINIPAKTNIITISGEVINSTSLSIDSDYKLLDYIEAAGGFQKTANKSEILLMRLNGEAKLIPTRKYLKRNGLDLRGGDQLIVLSKESIHGLKATGLMSSIIYQLALAAKVAMAI